MLTKTLALENFRLTICFNTLQGVYLTWWPILSQHNEILDHIRIIEAPNKGVANENIESDKPLTMMLQTANSTPGEIQEGHEEIHFRHLLQQISLKDEEALSEFYRIFQSRIFAFALSRLSDPNEASDLLNEVMWEIWRGAGRFEGRSSVLTWVFAITHHKIIDRARAHFKHPMEALTSNIPDERNQRLDDALHDQQEREFLYRGIHELSDVHRQVVHLAFFEDFSQKEISEILGCPEGTVRARMFYAKRALKRYLEENRKKERTNDA